MVLDKLAMGIPAEQESPPISTSMPSAMPALAEAEGQPGSLRVFGWAREADAVRNGCAL